MLIFGSSFESILTKTALYFTKRTHKTWTGNDATCLYGSVLCITPIKSDFFVVASFPISHSMFVVWTYREYVIPNVSHNLKRLFVSFISQTFCQLLSHQSINLSERKEPYTHAASSKSPSVCMRTFTQKAIKGMCNQQAWLWRQIWVFPNTHSLLKSIN